MSQENVEVVGRWIAAMSAGPAAIGAGREEALAAVAEFWDADIDYYPVRKFSGGQPCHGPEEYSQFVARWLEAWFRLEWEVEELIEVGDDRVLVCAHLRAEGRGSGARLEGDLYQCVWLRHGRFFRIEEHLTLSGALHALGLEGATLDAVGLRE